MKISKWKMIGALLSVVIFSSVAGAQDMVTYGPARLTRDDARQLEMMVAGVWKSQNNENRALTQVPQSLVWLTLTQPELDAIVTFGAERRRSVPAATAGTTDLTKAVDVGMAMMTPGELADLKTMVRRGPTFSLFTSARGDRAGEKALARQD